MDNHKKKSQAYTVTEPDQLLPFLLSHVKGLSRNSIKSLLSRRQITVEGKVETQFSVPLKIGQQVCVLPKACTVPVLPFELLYEDQEIIVINKPCGLLSIATDQEKTQTAYHILTDYVRAKGADNRLFVIHRLDRDTSGVLMFAKNEARKLAFQNNWDSIIRERRYVSVVEGIVHPPESTIHSWLKETRTHLVYSVPEPGGDAKEAITHYKVLQQSEAYALVQISLDTGRKNQIRVHMKELGNPVAGDKKYGAKTNPIRRLALHADQLSFVHPVSGEEYTFTAKTPKEFTRILRG